MKRLIDGVVDSVIAQPSKIKPIIVSFQNGQLKDEEAKKMSCGLFHDAKKRKRVLAMSSGQIVYKGYEPDEKNELTRTMLVFHNKRTGKIRLVEAARWSISAVLEKAEVDSHKIAEDERHTLLNKQFGSKKVKRRTEQYEKLKINVNNVKQDLEKAVSSIEVKKDELITPIVEADNVNASFPPCNRSASDVEDVYNVYDIVPQDKLETLYEEAREIAKNEVDNNSSRFHSMILTNLKLESHNVKKISLLLYINSVATWLNLHIKEAKKRALEICPSSEIIRNYIIDTYSIQSNSGRLRPNSMRDKGVIHCMILALIICNFKLDLELFSSIFKNKMGMKKLTNLARIIGAIPTKEDKKIVILKVPLPTQLSTVRKVVKK